MLLVYCRIGIIKFAALSYTHNKKSIINRQLRLECGFKIVCGFPCALNIQYSANTKSQNR